MTPSIEIQNDWYPGTVPENVVADETADLGSSYSFQRFRSRVPNALTVGHAAMLAGTLLDVGPDGRIHIGEYAMITSACIICETEILIGPYAMISWNVVIMDTYRSPFSAASEVKAAEPTANPFQVSRAVRLERNTWVGFEACILPGVTIGEGSIVGARSVVVDDVPPYAIVAGNPARVVRDLPRCSTFAGRPAGSRQADERSG